MEIVMGTENALRMVLQHMEAHVAEHHRQMLGWREAFDRYGEDLNAWAKQEDPRQTRPEEPPRPESFEADYRRLVAILEAHEEDTIRLDAHDQREVVLDQFSWKVIFTANSATYTGHVGF